FVATDHEISHGRDITWTLRAKEAPEHISEAWIGTSWIVEVSATGSRGRLLSTCCAWRGFSRYGQACRR
ncbi:MAG: hypothetical protein ACK550_14975, partial [Synechococcaceae cyanobacterium]